MRLLSSHRTRKKPIAKPSIGPTKSQSKTASMLSMGLPAEASLNVPYHQPSSKNGIQPLSAKKPVKPPKSQSSGKERRIFGDGS